MPSGLSKANDRQTKSHKKQYDVYKNEDRLQVNQAKRLVKHLSKFPWDNLALVTLKNINKVVLARAGIKVPSLAESPVQFRAKNMITLTQQRRVRQYFQEMEDFD